MRKHLLIFTLFVINYVPSANAIDFSRVNVAWQYNVNFEVQMSHRVISENKNTTIFLRIASSNLNSWEYEFLVQDGYNSESHREILLDAIDTLHSTSNQVLLKILLPQLDENLLVVKFSKPENFYYYDISLKVGSLNHPEVYPVDAQGLPILENYVKRSGFSWKGSDSFLAMRYAEGFPEANPPMADMVSLAPQIDLDSTFVFTDSVEFTENYFYTVRKDSLSNTGVTVLKVPPYFPEYRRLVELIESMFYLVSSQEKKSILSSSNPKESFDSFWMNTYLSKARARIAIRKYYNKVELANRLYTDFKPGWKTDRGMIHIVFGAPDEVYRSGNFEEWFYDDGHYFEFTIISTFFAAKTYALRRSNELEEQWYEQISALRRDINE